MEGGKCKVGDRGQEDDEQVHKSWNTIRRKGDILGTIQRRDGQMCGVLVGEVCRQDGSREMKIGDGELVKGM